MELGILPFYPGNSPFYAIWDAPCYLATCVKLFGTYHILHRVGGLFVVLRFQILVYGCLGFLGYGEAILVSSRRVACLAEALGVI